MRQTNGRRRNKYKVSNASERTFNGRTYGSKAEMQYAKLLYVLRDENTICEFIEQPRLWLGVPENVYVPDFFIVPYGEPPYYVDVKGQETAKFNRDKKLWSKYGRLCLRVVKFNYRKGTFATSEVVEPK